MTPYQEFKACGLNAWCSATGCSDLPTLAESLRGVIDPLTCSVRVTLPPTPPTPTVVADALACDGSTTPVDVKDEAATPVFIKGQELPFVLCVGKEFDKTILCNVNTGAKVILVTSYDPVTGVPTTTQYNLDGSINTDPISDLESCGDSDTESDQVQGCGDGVQVVQWIEKKNGVATGVVYYTNSAGIVIPAPGVFTIGDCPEAAQIAQVPNCAGTLDDKPVDEVNAVYLLNQENKHTEVVYDVVTAVFGGAATFTYTAPQNVAIAYAGITLANDTLVQYWTDYGDGYNDVGPSPDHAYNSDGAYEIKGYAITASGNKVLLFAKEITILNGVVTYSGVQGSQAVSRTYTRLVASAFQDYCGSLPVGSAYNADGTAYTLVGDFIVSSPPVIDDLEDNANWNPEEKADLKECTTIVGANIVTEATDPNLIAAGEVATGGGGTITTYHTMLGNPGLNMAGNTNGGAIAGGINVNVGTAITGAQFTYTINVGSDADPGDPADLIPLVWNNVTGASVTATSITTSLPYSGFDAQGTGLNMPLYGYPDPLANPHTIVWTGDLPAGDYTVVFLNQNQGVTDNVTVSIAHNIVEGGTPVVTKAQLTALDECTIAALTPDPVIPPIEVPGGMVAINAAALSVVAPSNVRSFSVKGLNNKTYDISFDGGTNWLIGIDGGDSWGEGNEYQLNVSQVVIRPTNIGDRVFIHWEVI